LIADLMLDFHCDAIIDTLPPRLMILPLIFSPPPAFSYAAFRFATFLFSMLLIATASSLLHCDYRRFSHRDVSPMPPMSYCRY